MNVKIETVMGPCDLGRFNRSTVLDTRLGHGQLCLISRSNTAGRSYGPDTDFVYVCTVTLTLGIQQWKEEHQQLKTYH